MRLSHLQIIYCCYLFIPVIDIIIILNAALLFSDIFPGAGSTLINRVAMTNTPHARLSRFLFYEDKSRTITKALERANDFNTVYNNSQVWSLWENELTGGKGEEGSTVMELTPQGTDSSVLTCQR